jgi:hypothetical protein
MSKHNSSKSSDHFDLLPFIAILMCLLGTLLLITMGMTAINLGPGAQEGWTVQSDTINKSKTPILIEWDGDSAVIHKNTRKVVAKWSSSTQEVFVKNGKSVQFSDSLNLDSALWNVIVELKRDHNFKFALFAVRPSGFKTFTLFAEEFRNRNITIAKEPIEQDKNVQMKRLEDKNAKK